jgi:hypothetical protein
MQGGQLMARPAKTLREAARDLTLMSDDGSEYEHNDGCQGEPDCPACWVEGIRQLFADFPVESTPVASSERVAAVLHGFEHDRLRSRCPGSDECELWYDADVRAQYLLAASVFRVDATVKAEALREAAEAQRQLARDSRTGNGNAEHEDRADWLDDRAAALEPRLERAHP